MRARPCRESTSSLQHKNPTPKRLISRYFKDQKAWNEVLPGYFACAFPNYSLPVYYTIMYMQLETIVDAKVPLFQGLGGSVLFAAAGFGNAAGLR